MVDWHPILCRFALDITHWCVPLMPLEAWGPWPQQCRPAKANEVTSYDTTEKTVAEEYSTIGRLH